ncbi:unnamed protein product [Acanthosepion pharaonis]|uniref:Acyltransferase 3 domain-containing protein n=1 Tax=Acanthosepion pharaonis TaxID=158019 RepID=A0A812BMG6_ACAPH|nr:unnamed protein product [Sepia pharaonis]
MWVILGHTYIFGISVWRNMATLLSLFKRFTFQVISNALFSVDTFFMLSGLLVTYGIMKAMKKQNNKHNWVYFYAHRFWRKPKLGGLILLVLLLAHFISSGVISTVNGFGPNMFGTSGTPGDAMSQELSSLYTALARTVWALSVGWVIYACSTGYGGFVNTILSWKAFIPLSRLTYCAYLVHPIILQSFYLKISIYL